MSITLCIHGPKIRNYPPVLSAADSRSTERPLRTVLGDCAEDSLRARRGLAPNATARALSTPVDATLCAVGGCQHAAGRDGGRDRERIISQLERPGRYVRRVTGPFAGFATGAPATTPTRAQ